MAVDTRDTSTPSLFPTRETDPRWLSLFGEADPNLVAKFLAFHERNPDMFTLWVQLARQAKEAGRVRFSHWVIAQRIRWYTDIETTGKRFKLSNDYIGPYARLLAFIHPEFEGFFDLRAMKPKRGAAEE